MLREKAYGHGNVYFKFALPFDADPFPDQASPHDIAAMATFQVFIGEQRAVFLLQSSAGWHQMRRKTAHAADVPTASRKVGAMKVQQCVVL